MYEFKLPDLGEGIHEGEILEWHVKPGDVIEEDADLVDVETDKAAVTIPSPVGGKVVSLGGKEGDVISVGDVLAVIDSGEAEAADAPAKEPEKAAEPESAPVPSTPPPAAGGPVRPVPAAPATRRLARELGVDLFRVTPTGPSGRVTDDDVRRHAGGVSPPPPSPATDVAAPAPFSPAVDVSTPTPSPPEAGPAIPFYDLEPLPDFTRWGPVEREPLRSIRRKVARKMVASMTIVPHVANMDEVDVTKLEALRKAENKRRQGEFGGHLTLLAFVIKAVTAGLEEFPQFNSSLDPVEQEIVYKKYFNIGIAADTGRGLVVPVIHEADRKSIARLAAEIEDKANRAREGTLTVDDLQGGTFTITNIGPLGSTVLIPAINYPEVAILGMGKMQDKPVVRNGAIVIRKILPVTLAFDHRIADGADAARFMHGVTRRLSDPKLLLIEA